MVTKKSRLAFPETVERLIIAITKAENEIFATIDQAEAAGKSGLTLRPTTLLIFGNPKGGTPLMEEYPAVGLDLPLKVLVWEEAEGVRVAYWPATEIAARYEILDMDLPLSRMDGVLDVITDSII